MSDGGIVTAEVGGFTVTTNSGATSDQIRNNLKTRADESVSSAGRELGKLGAKAAAEKRAETKETPEEKPEVEAKGEEAPEAKKEPEAEAEKAEAKPEERAEEKPEANPPDLKQRKYGPPAKDGNARIREATRETAEYRRLLAEEKTQRSILAARLETLERLARSIQTPSEAKPEHPPEGKPSPDGYSTYEEYLDARDEWNRRQWDSQIEKRNQASAQERGLTQAVERFRSAAVSVVDQISPEVAGLRTEFQLGPGEKPSGENWIANEFVFSPEQAPALMLYFTAHPSELQRIATLSTPRAVSREMAKLEARLESATTGISDSSSRRDSEVSKAEPPVKPVTGKPYVTEGDEYRPGMSLDEYAKVWTRNRQRNR